MAKQTIVRTLRQLIADAARPDDYLMSTKELKGLVNQARRLNGLTELTGGLNSQEGQGGLMVRVAKKINRPRRDKQGGAKIDGTQKDGSSLAWLVKGNPLSTRAPCRMVNQPNALRYRLEPEDEDRPSVVVLERFSTVGPLYTFHDGVCDIARTACEAPLWALQQGPTAGGNTVSVELHLDKAGRLHALDRPAATFADGAQLYALHGLFLPVEYFATTPPAEWLALRTQPWLENLLSQLVGPTNTSDRRMATGHLRILDSDPQFGWLIEGPGSYSHHLVEISGAMHYIYAEPWTVYNAVHQVLSMGKENQF